MGKNCSYYIEKRQAPCGRLYAESYDQCGAHTFRATKPKEDIFSRIFHVQHGCRTCRPLLAHTIVSRQAPATHNILCEKQRAHSKVKCVLTASALDLQVISKSHEPKSGQDCTVTLCCFVWPSLEFQGKKGKTKTLAWAVTRYWTNLDRQNPAPKPALQAGDAG